jgi:hypothetical protein
VGPEGARRIRGSHVSSRDGGDGDAIGRTAANLQRESGGVFVFYELKD